MDEIARLLKENDILRNRITKLEKQIELLVHHPTIAQGLRGERLICDLTDGSLTKPQESYDIILKNQIKLEIKYSKLHKHGRGESYRWHWGKPLGQNMQKDYDYLLLMGEKDDRYDQYLDNEHDVCFLIPIEEVKNISVSDRTYGSQLNLNTNFATVKTARGKKIIKHMVSCSTIKKLTSKARPY